MGLFFRLKIVSKRKITHHLTMQITIRGQESYLLDFNGDESLEELRARICERETPIFFHFRFLNTTFLLVLVVAGIWRGGSYYIFVFSKVYNKKFEPDQNVGQVEKKD